jgi:hypothetical protein
MKIKKALFLLLVILLQSFIFSEKSYGEVDCIDMMLTCWESNPYEPGTTPYVIFNDACEAAGSACVRQNVQHEG